MTPPPDPRAHLVLSTWANLADGPLHRTDEITAKAILLLYIDEARQEPVETASVDTIMVANPLMFARLAQATLDYLAAHIESFDEFVEGWRAGRDDWAVADEEVVLDQPPLPRRPRDGSPG